ncbi:MAG: HepT-like ribonuclease domain-containing protein [Pseudomonadota bacterium]
MRLEAKKYLYDMTSAVQLLVEFTNGKSFDDFAREAMLRAAVEREFEIIGEALTQLAKLDAELASRITDHRRIIAFRNILIHGYANVDPKLVWDVVESKLPVLAADIARLLECNSPE